VAVAGGDVIPTWTRWPFRGIRLGAVVIAVSAVVVAVGGAWPTAVVMICATVWPAAFPWMWKVAYRSGYEAGRLEEWNEMLGR
jgi:hypothetical protein